MATLPTTKTSLVFNVLRGKPELIAPARPTPHEFKQLSDIDECMQGYTPFIQFYRYVTSMEGKDTVDLIKKAIADALVFYYPVAGRLRKGAADKELEVECNGEGILFMEADAEVTIDQFGDPILPPFPCSEKLIFSAPTSVDGMLNFPFLLVQVTRFQCGGFVIAANLSHMISDGPGAMQFMKAIGEMACGAQIPSISPVWERHIFDTQTLPHKKYAQLELEQGDSNDTTIDSKDFIYQSFVFGTSEMSALRSLFPLSLGSTYSSFELITACLWKHRTIALQIETSKNVYMIFAINARGNFNPPIVPSGYYGNGFTLAMTVATAGEICHKSLEFLLELIRKAKEDALKEFMQCAKSSSDIMNIVKIAGIRSYIISDIRRSGIEEVNFGLGKVVFAGVGNASPRWTVYTSHENKKGENGILVPICLPSLVMKRFVSELNKMFKKEFPIVASIE